MKKYVCLVITCLVFISCNREQRTPESITEPQSIDSLQAVQEEPAPRSDDTLAFETAFTQLFQALQKSDTATINQFIHPKYGLWVIEQPGALPKMTRVTRIQDFKREYQNRPFLTIAQEVKTCDLKAEAWPDFDCADMNYDEKKSGYSKDGCFVAGPVKFQKSGYWDYASLQPAQIESIKATLPLLQQSVLHTNTSFEFHFGFIDGHWRLLFTKLIYPCSA